MKSLGLTMSTLEIMATRVLEGGHPAWRQSRNSTWIALDLVPSGTGRAQDSCRPGRSGGGRRRFIIFKIKGNVNLNLCGHEPRDSNDV